MLSVLQISPSCADSIQDDHATPDISRSKRPIEARAKKLLDAIDKPESAAHVFQFTFDWTWSVTQQGTVDGMSAGMAFAFPLAFVVLVIVTANYVVAGLAILSVCAVVGSVLGVCESMYGWNLGTGEAIAGVMVIGLAIDYLHLDTCTFTVDGTRN